jgi:hypothetical protein
MGQRNGGNCWPRLQAGLNACNVTMRVVTGVKKENPVVSKETDVVMSSLGLGPESDIELYE